MVSWALPSIGFYLTWHVECFTDEEKGEILMVKLKVNGIDRTFDGDPNMPLLWYVRDVLGLTGTKFGCGMALCGACTVHKNGEAIRSCVTPVSAAAGGEIRTIEDLGANGLHAVQQAWMESERPAVRILPVWSDHAGCFFSKEYPPSYGSAN